MKICVAGDCHGQILELYRGIQSFAENLGEDFDLVLQVGDFGIWPDAAKIDRASRNHGGAGDFQKLMREGWRPSIKTIFIKGNHEDFEYLTSRVGDDGGTVEILPDLVYLPNGKIIEVGGVIVASLGGCFGPSNFEKQILNQRAQRHYTRHEINGLCEQAQRPDILLLHDAPHEVVKQFPLIFPPDEQNGLDDLLQRVKPRMAFFGHYHRIFNGTVNGVDCFGLNKTPHQGCLLAIDTENWSVVDDFGKKQ